jgi:hypothetical protein
MTLAFLFSVLRPSGALPDPFRILLPSVPYDVIAALVIGPLAVSIHDRMVDEERAAR